MSEIDPIIAVASSIKEVATAISLSGSDWHGDALSLIGPLLTAIVAIFSIWYQGRAARKVLEDNARLVQATIASETARQFGGYYLKYRLRQLNEFYGRIHSLNKQSKALAEKLKAGKEEGWHVLHNLKEVKSDKESMALLRAIVAKNDQIVELFEQKGSLMKDFDKQPKSFDLFYQHHSYIRLAVLNDAWEPSNKIETFPTQFDDDIETICRELNGEVMQLLASANSVLLDNRRNSGP